MRTPQFILRIPELGGENFVVFLHGGFSRDFLLNFTQPIPHRRPIQLFLGPEALLHFFYWFEVDYLVFGLTFLYCFVIKYRLSFAPGAPFILLNTWWIVSYYGVFPSWIEIQLFLALPRQRRIRMLIWVLRRNIHQFILHLLLTLHGIGILGWSKSGFANYCFCWRNFL